jgi:hypothetical protein
MYSVDHHGSRTSSVASFLAYLQPEIAVCQNGIDNGYGHPNRLAVSRINSNEQDSGAIRFRDAAGSSAPVPISGTVTDTIAYTLAPWGTFEVETAGTGTLSSGTIEVHSDREEDSVIEGTEVFEALGSYVSVASAPPRSMNQVYVSVSASENTGVALYNPDKQNTVSVHAVLVDSTGVQRATRLLEIEPGRQQLSFVDEAALFADYFEDHPEDFQGTLNLIVEEQGEIAVLGLLQKRSSGALIAIVGSGSAFNP